MSIRNQSWHNLNSSRAYPFDDSASLQDDAGDQLPTDILVGLKVMVPESAGQYVFVGGMSVSAKIITLTLLAAQDLDGTGAVPVLSISITAPFTRYTPHKFESRYPQAGGWMTLGPGGDNQVGYSGRFASPRQSLLAPKAARWFKELPISGAGKLANPTLTGLVALIGGSDIEIVSECREVPGNPVPSDQPQYCGSDELGTQVRDVIVFRLKDDSAAQDQNVFDLYKGQCGTRPESRNCGHPEPVEFLGPVPPDCDGNITLNFTGCAKISEVVEEATLDDLGDPVSVDQACGIIIDCDLGLSEACVTKDRLPDEDGRLPNEYDDLCLSVSFDSESEVTGPTPVFEFSSLSAANDVDAALPFADDFDIQLGDYVVRHGEFKYREDTDSGGYILTADSPAMRNVVTYEPTPSIITTFHKKVSARIELRDASLGALHNGAVFANYRETSPGSGRYSYYAAEIDQDGHYRGFKLFRIAKYTGTGWTTLFSLAVPGLKRQDRYDVSLEIYPQTEDPNNAWLVADLVGVDDPSINETIGPIAVSNYAPEPGVFGMGSNRSVSRFHNFSVENITTYPS